MSVSRTSGNTGLTASPATLTFTPANWNTARKVTVTAADIALAMGSYAELLE